MKHPENIRIYFLLLLITGVLFLSAKIVAPFFEPVALAMVAAVALQGLYKRMVLPLPQWPGVAALLTVMISMVVILLPLYVIGTFVISGAQSAYTSLQQPGEQSTIAKTLVQFGASLDTISPSWGALIRGISTNVDTYTKGALQWVSTNVSDIFSGAVSLLISFIIFFISLYYFLRDGGSMLRVFASVFPVNDGEHTRVLAKLTSAVNSVIWGNLAIMLIHGVVITIGLALFGVPNSILWGTAAAFAAFIPGIGTGLVAIPSIIFLLAIGAVPQALGLFVWWSVGAVGIVDNVISPKLVGKGMHVHPLLVLLAITGGILFFGIAGVLLGPLVISLLLALVSVYIDPKTA